MSTITREDKTSFSQHLQGLQNFVTLQVEQLLKIVFAMTQAGGVARNLALIWFPILLWTFTAIVLHPLSGNVLQGFSASFKEILSSLEYSDPWNSLGEGTLKLFVYSALIVFQVFIRLFSAEIFRHVLTIVIPFIMALRIATLYLNHIFEPEHEGVAFRFIRETAFAFGYHKLNIENGRVAKENEDSPLLLIGGPGIVQSRLENVAVFEKLDGQVHIIGQRPGEKKPSNVIEGFERLREVIDLRNQITQTNELSVEGRTRDGIHIIAQNVRLDFCVQRHPSINASLNATNPYSYSDDAVKSLIYKRISNMPWQAVMKGMVRRNLQEFIAEHRLSEFLAASDLPEVENQAPVINFIPRQEITDLFLSTRFTANAARLGLQLNWIDIGTWVAPKSAVFVTQRNLDAWKIARENAARSRKLVDDANESRLEELHRLIRDVPLVTYSDAHAKNTPEDAIKTELLYAYLGILRSAQADQAQAGAMPSAELDAAINFLGRYLKDRKGEAGEVRWL